MLLVGTKKQLPAFWGGSIKTNLSSSQIFSANPNMQCLLDRNKDSPLSRSCLCTITIGLMFLLNYQVSFLKVEKNYPSSHTFKHSELVVDTVITTTTHLQCCPQMIILKRGIHIRARMNKRKLYVWEQKNLVEKDFEQRLCN